MAQATPAECSVTAPPEPSLRWKGANWSARETTGANGLSHAVD